MANALSNHCTVAWVTRPKRPKGRKLEVGAPRAPRLLVYIYVCRINLLLPCYGTIGSWLLEPGNTLSMSMSFHQKIKTPPKYPVNLKCISWSVTKPQHKCQGQLIKRHCHRSYVTLNCHKRQSQYCCQFLSTVKYNRSTWFSKKYVVTKYAEKKMILTHKQASDQKGQ